MSFVTVTVASCYMVVSCILANALFHPFLLYPFDLLKKLKFQNRHRKHGDQISSAETIIP